MSHVRLHPIVIRPEDDAWIVGRPEAASFVAVPVAAVTFIRALQAGAPVAAAEENVRLEHGDDIDGADFVRTMIELGFVAAVDDQPLPDRAEPPSLRWLRPAHVRWLFRAPAYTVAALLILTGLTIGVLNGSLLPSYRDYFVTGWQGVNLALNTALFLAVAAMHECAHLAAARAANLHARIGLGTRLQFLTAQTTVTGLWGASRRIRFRVYLVGMATDLATIAVAHVLLASGLVDGVAAAILRALILGQFLAVATQFALYLRTDVYFVLQELLRCKNLYADAWAYVRYLARRAIGRRTPDPTRAIPSRERIPVKVYSVAMAVGSGVSLGLFVGYGAPVLINLLVRAAGQVAHGWASGAVLPVIDGLLVIGIHTTLQAIFLKVFLRRFHQQRPADGRQ